MTRKRILVVHINWYGILQSEYNYFIYVYISILKWHKIKTYLGIIKNQRQTKPE